MALLVSWSNTCPVVSHALLSSKNFSIWLSHLVLEDPDPTVRREISTALFRLCTTNPNIAPVLLLELIKFIDKAERMRPQRHEVIIFSLYFRYLFLTPINGMRLLIIFLMFVGRVFSILKKRVKNLTDPLVEIISGCYAD